MDLQPEAEYEFRVIAHNSAGFGEPSTASSIIQLRPQFGDFASRKYADQQERGVPYSPGRPQIIAMDGTSVTLVWEPPIENGSGGPVTGYNVEYRPPATEWLLANDYPVQGTSYTGVYCS